MGHVPCQDRLFDQLVTGNAVYYRRARNGNVHIAGSGLGEPGRSHTSLTLLSVLA